MDGRAQPVLEKYSRDLQPSFGFCVATSRAIDFSLGDKYHKRDAQGP